MTRARPSELLVIAASKPWACADCSAEFGGGEFLTMDDAGPLCLRCADLDHLLFLARGDAALTRRARKVSRLSAVVVRWSRARKRSERQGILAEPGAIAQAEHECLGDSEVRERRRVRDARRRAVEDEEFVTELAAAVCAQFPGCPHERALRIAGHAGARSSGRIGRTSAGRALDPEAVRLAVIAAIRHEDTNYEDLLMNGVSRAEARDLVRDDIDRLMNSWATGR
ncbi:MAG: hypothetical protein QOK15_2200 [Nocardioidaceae bacterium]|nr:hypothetical protein [Nocardioidaceae bacterium]